MALTGLEVPAEEDHSISHGLRLSVRVSNSLLNKELAEVPEEGERGMSDHGVNLLRIRQFPSSLRLAPQLLLPAHLLMNFTSNRSRYRHSSHYRLGPFHQKGKRTAFSLLGDLIKVDRNVSGPSNLLLTISPSLLIHRGRIFTTRWTSSL